MMRLYLAGFDTASRYRYGELLFKSKYILVSFWYTRKVNKKIFLDLIIKRNNEDRLILDSGAFTFLNSDSKMNMDEYLDEYIKFINKYDIKRFAELDIDPIVGYEKTMLMRDRLERETGKKCIPVWHKSRGIQAFKDDVEKYSYVAIGGIVTKEIKRNEFPIFKKLTRYAKARGVKVHGLGFTGKDCYEYGFYSVDSTSWSSGMRYASTYKFIGNELKMIKKPENTRLKDGVTIDKHNIVEWIKFQRYVERFRLWCMQLTTIIKKLGECKNEKTNQTGIIYFSDCHCELCNGLLCTISHRYVYSPVGNGIYRSNFCL